jgi:hypothetical protein
MFLGQNIYRYRTFRTAQRTGYPEAWEVQDHWIPAFAGMTAFEDINLIGNELYKI